MIEVLLITLLVALTVSVLIWPEAAIAALFALYAMEQLYQTHIAIFVQIPLLLNAYVAILLMIACVKRVLSSQIAFPWSGTAAFLALFLIFVAFSSIWSRHSPAATLLANRAPYWALWLLLAPLILRNFHDLRRSFTVLCILAPIVLLGLMFTSERFEGRRTILLGDTQGNPLQVATLGGNLIILAVCLNPAFSRVKEVAVRWLLVATGLAATIWAGTRGQTFAAIMASIVAYPVTKRMHNLSRFFATAAGVLILIGGTLWAATQFGGYRFQLNTIASTYQSSRVEMSMRLLDAWSDAGPLTWIQGLGTSSSFAVLGTWCHVLYVEILAELGFAGLGLFAAATIAAGLAWVRGYAITKEFDQARGIWTALGALVLFEILIGFSNQRVITAEKLYGLLVIVGSMSRYLILYRKQLVV